MTGNNTSAYPTDLIGAWKVVRPDLTSRNGYRWPFPGQWAVGDQNLNPANGAGVCPTREGDGLSLAKTFYGAAQGGRSAVTGLIVGYRPEDVLAEDFHELRVRRAFVCAIIDIQAELHRAPGAYLYGAYLAGANLAGANLTRANLTRAYLYGANLTRAYLYGADLAGANLTRAYLYRANLAGANLAGANLTRANLYGADRPTDPPAGWVSSEDGLLVREGAA